MNGAGKYLREKKKDLVRIAVCPDKKHDIPGVRSIEQVTVTDHYRPDIYDHLEEISNEAAFNMCLQLNQKDAIPCGPSSGMQVVAALRRLPDTPGTVGVVIFCDNIFKYASSVPKYCPSVFPTPDAMLEPAEVTALTRVYVEARDGASTVKREELVDALSAEPLVVDVRPAEEFESRKRIRGAVNIPLSTILGEDGGDQVVRLSDKAGVVQRANGSKRQRIGDGFLARELLHKGPDVLLYCNRGKDSLLAVMALRVALGKAARHVGDGMFAAAEAGVAMDGPDVLPPAADDVEANRLAKLGYGRAGEPNSQNGGP